MWQNLVSHLLPAMAAGLFALAPPAAAQVLRGTVVDSSSGKPIAGVHVTAHNARSLAVGSAVTGASGSFSFQLPVIGSYRIEATRIGYMRTITESITVDTKFESSVRLTLRPNPVPLDTLTVVPERVITEKQIPWLVDAGFYDRRLKGWGYFLTHDEIEQHSPMVMSDALRGLAGVRVACARATLCDLLMPGAQSMFFRGTCYPSIVLDGVVVRVGGVSPADTLDDVLNPFNIAAVEVYPSPAGVPVQYGGYVSPCGAILAWSQR